MSRYLSQAVARARRPATAMARAVTRRTPSPGPVVATSGAPRAPLAPENARGSLAAGDEARRIGVGRLASSSTPQGPAISKPTPSVDRALDEDGSRHGPLAGTAAAAAPLRRLGVEQSAVPHQAFDAPAAPGTLLKDDAGGANRTAAARLPVIERASDGADVAAASDGATDATPPASESPVIVGAQRVAGEGAGGAREPAEIRLCWPPEAASIPRENQRQVEREVTRLVRERWRATTGATASRGANHAVRLDVHIAQLIVRIENPLPPVAPREPVAPQPAPASGAGDGFAALRFQRSLSGF